MEQVENYEGYYVDKSGCVYSQWKGNGRRGGRSLGMSLKKLKQQIQNGYKYVTLVSDKGRRAIPVHRIVATAYLPLEAGKGEVNHKDKDRLNNHCDNLEWCDRQYNVEHSQALTYEFTSPEGVKVTVFNLNKFCKANSLNTGCMCEVHSGKRNQHKGWKK